MVRSPRIPKYRRHSSGQARITINGKDHLLGPYNSAASKEAYQRIVAEWLANPGKHRPYAMQAVQLAVSELIAAYWKFACKHYFFDSKRRRGDFYCLRDALKTMRSIYGRTLAQQFGPLALKACRHKMIQKGWSRKYINAQIDRIRRMFRWAAEEELLPASVYQNLRAVAGLRFGKSEARETEHVKPVPEAHINAVRSFVSKQVEALIDLQLLTGMRPGEACMMRACDLDMTGRIWVYRPPLHKTLHHGHKREIYVGPRGQAIIKPFLKTDLQAYLFSPNDAREDRFQVMRQKRKSKVQPSQVCRRKNRPKKVPKDHYNVASYRRAISYACQQAFPLPEHLGPRIKPDGKRETRKEWKARLTPQEKEEIRAWRREHSWHPHQLRHNAATNLRREFGVELARIILGHATAFTTEIYAEADRQQAMDVIGRVG